MAPEPRKDEGTGSRPRGTGSSLGLEESIALLEAGGRRGTKKFIGMRGPLGCSRSSCNHGRLFGYHIGRRQDGTCGRCTLRER